MLVRQLPNTAAFILSPDEETNKIFFIASVPQALVARGLNAKEWAESVSSLIEGKTGGNDKTAQGSGANVALLDKARQAAESFATSKLGKK